MYDILKKLLSVAEKIGTIQTVNQTIRDRKYYDYDEIKIVGMAPDGRKFVLEFELKDKKESENADS